MPEFMPLAGFSPSCEAVFVQIEHWAFTALLFDNTSKQEINKINALFFIRSIFVAKIRPDMLQKF